MTVIKNGLPYNERGEITKDWAAAGTILLLLAVVTTAEIVG